MADVLLLSMPFGALERQALGLSLLKAALERDGTACAVRYPTFAFADAIGVDAYRWIQADLPYTAFAGDWLFTQALYDDGPARDHAYVRDVLRGAWRFSDADVARLLRLRQAVPYFLDSCLATLPWREAAVVGFTSTFEQNVASLALARRMKALAPEVTVVFGGANWEGEMGEELHRQFPFVDYACSGEADHSFPTLVHALLREGGRGVEAIPGVVRREGGATVTGPPAVPVREMDTLPVPDFSDYFDAVATSASGVDVVPHLLLETSRGCWWGAKSHCTFCGLNGNGMTFRSKSGARALEELRGLVDRWGVEYVEVVDNILDMRYFRDVLPTLAEEGGPVRLFYEVKANLNREQVRLLAAAGVDRIQPGIESLSDHVLSLMRKGTTGLQNVQLLKWCREYGVTAEWNVLFGFPGETRADYEAMLALFPAIRFLRAPTGWGPVRLDRFSPYFHDPEGFGMRNVRPMAPYPYLYPVAPEALRRIAYYFDYDYAPEVDPGDVAGDVIAYVRDWLHAPEQGALVAVPRPDGALALLDSRSTALRPEVLLQGPERTAYEFCDEARTPAAVARHLLRHYPERPAEEAAVTGFLDALVAHGLMISDGTRYLSLALGAAPSAAPAAPAPPAVPAYA